VHLGHHIRDANGTQESIPLIPNDETATFFRKHIERMPTNFMKNLVRNRATLETQIKFNSF